MATLRVMSFRSLDLSQRSSFSAGDRWQLGAPSSSASLAPRTTSGGAAAQLNQMETGTSCLEPRMRAPESQQTGRHATSTVEQPTKLKKPLTVTKRTAMLGYLVCLAAGPIASSSHSHDMPASTYAAAPDAHELFTLAGALPSMESGTQVTVAGDRHESDALDATF